MKKYLKPLLFLSFTSFACFAGAQEFGPPIISSVTITGNDSLLKSANQPYQKQIALMNLHLSDQQKQMLNQFQPLHEAQASSKEGDLPTKALIEMKNVPVLDQGMHGTCVTFATTAAIDSLLQKGDYVSPLCSLMLGKYLEERSYYPSGWDGSRGPMVLNQFLQYGIVTKEQQKKQSCAGIKTYPMKDSPEELKPYSYQDLSDYTNVSQNINEHLFWEPLLSFAQRFSIDPSRAYKGDEVLHEVKRVLSSNWKQAKSRITFGVLLPYTHCSTGACATYHQRSDTWALTDEIKRDRNPNLGGHEMMIIGYDDNAVAMGNDGSRHQGLLILRNSWGNKVGDQGNFYMTYDFFKHYVNEIQNLIYI